MTTEALNKSDLIERISLKNPHLAEPLVEEAVKIMIDQMIAALSSDNRIEIRGFGSFALHHREPRIGRNPKTGKSVEVAAKAVPHFKPADGPGYEYLTQFFHVGCALQLLRPQLAPHGFVPDVDAQYLYVVV